MQTVVQSSDRAARIKRIRRRGCPEVIQTLERGELGIKSLERLTRLPASKQSKELVRLLEERKTKRERQAAWRATPRCGAALFASQGYEEARKRRLRRIQRRATAELQEAYQEGRLSLRAYDRISKLSAQRQRKTIMSDRQREQAQTQAVLTIRAVLAQQPQRIDLGLIARKIIASIREKTVAL
jgi:hypothetical protein